MKNCGEDKGFDFISDTEKSAKKDYKKLVTKITKHHTKNDSLNEKLDKLLSYIEVLPGGEEYEKAKDRFVNLEN